VLPKGLGLDLATVMNVLGATADAYFGLLDVGAFKEGDVVVVSGAAGATGSVVGQIRGRGAGKSSASRRRGEVQRGRGEIRLRRVCRLSRSATHPTPPRGLPEGIDLYFDNVVATFSTRRWRTLRCTRAS